MWKPRILHKPTADISFISHYAVVEFTEAAKVHSNDDGVSRHRLAPFNAYYTGCVYCLHTHYN